MPMLDYQCSNSECGLPFESFSHPGHSPTHADCPHCGTFAARETDPFITLRRPASNALRFDPIAIDRRKEAGEWVYSYPGSNTEPVSEGYERIYITNMSQADKHTREVGGKEQELRSMNLQLERGVWDQRTKERREDTRALIARRGWSGKIFEAVCKQIDAQREKRYAQLERKQVDFHNQALSFNQSNRMAHCDINTGWKDRR